MTPSQVSALTDTELNRAMIWLYLSSSDEYDESKWGWRDKLGVVSRGAYENYFEADYLTDYNLTMPLAVENMLTIAIFKESVHVDDYIFAYFAEAEDPSRTLRAICEVLVLCALS